MVSCSSETRMRTSNCNSSPGVNVLSFPSVTPDILASDLPTPFGAIVPMGDKLNDVFNRSSLCREEERYKSPISNEYLTVIMRQEAIARGAFWATRSAARLKGARGASETTSRDPYTLPPPSLSGIEICLR